MEAARVITIIALFVALLTSHLSLAFWAGLRTPWSQAWKVLTKLCVVTSALWFVVATIISVANLIDAPRSAPAIEVYGNSFGIPYGLNIPGRFLPEVAANIPVWLQIGCETGVLLLAMFLIALLPYSIARLFSYGGARKTNN